ncbi:MAG: hypothetical protein HYV07_01805 [Deltaproteobacteria bacterium]|nr:hypothetical protein [Deltaproteobacteria bacterium]
MGLCAAIVGCPKGRPSVPTPPELSVEARARARDRLPAVIPRDGSFRRGIALGLFASAEARKDREAVHSTLIDEVAALGATDLELVVSWAQLDVRSSTLSRDESSVTDAELELAIAKARSLGLRVFLMPILRVVETRPSQWRGTLEPSDPKAWWRSYFEFVLHYAELSERTGVELFSVGSELVSLEREEARWRELISEVRKRFRGQLIYSANWDHFAPVGFWDALDFMGVSAYAPASSKRDPSEELLVEGIWAFRSQLLTFASEHELRVILTEAGFPSNPRGTFRPWEYGGGGPADPELQLRAYRAFYRVWNDTPRLHGLYFWNWFGRGGLDDPGYSLRGKPALEVVRAWFTGGPRRAAGSPR